MVDVTETTPGTPITANQKSDVQAVPSGSEDNWWAAADCNKLLGFSVSTDRAIRLNAILAGISNTGETWATPLVVALNGTINATNELRQASKTLSTDLNKVFAHAVATLEQAGDRATIAASTPFYGLQAGLVTIASGAFATNTLLSFGASGQFVTWNGGALTGATDAPIGYVLNATTAYVNLNRRFKVDGTTVEFIDDSGVPTLRFNTAADLTLGTLTADTINVLSFLQSGGLTMVSPGGALKVPGTFSAAQGANINGHVYITQGNLYFDGRLGPGYLVDTLLSFTTATAAVSGGTATAYFTAGLLSADYIQLGKVHTKPGSTCASYSVEFFETAAHSTTTYRLIGVTTSASTPTTEEDESVGDLIKLDSGGLRVKVTNHDTSKATTMKLGVKGVTVRDSV